jgi:hypothetical protein
MAAVVRDLHFPKFRNPATTFHSLAPFHPPIICRANCAALVFLSCRVARSLAPSSLHSASSLGAHSSPGLPSRSRRRHVPLYTAVTATATSRPPLHRGPTRSRRQHVPSLHRGPNPVTAPAPLRSRPSAQAGTGHVTTPPPVRRTASPPGPATRDRPWCNASPRTWSVSPSGSPTGTVSARGHARPSPTWFPQRRPRHAPVWRRRQPVTALSGPRARPDPDTSRHDARAIRSPFALAEQANRANVLAKDPAAGAGVKHASQLRQAAQGRNCSRDMV